MELSAPQASLVDEALQWAARLSRDSIPVQDLKAFFAWRQSPAQAAAFASVLEARLHARRYIVRPAADAFNVIDKWTGWVVADCGAMTLTRAEAQDAAARLNWRAHPGYAF